MLDSVAPNNPVLLQDIDFHSYWANSLAIELAEVTADSPVPRGGEIVVGLETGELTGIFKEGAGALFDDAPGMSEATDPEVGIRSAIALANSLGITTVHDMSDHLDAFLSVVESTELTVRIWRGARRHDAGYPREEFVALAKDRERIRKRVAATGLTETKGPLFELGYVKFMVDGTLSTYTALMKEPYSDNPEADPAPRVSQKELINMVADAHENDVGSGTGAVARQDLAWLYPGFPPSCPVNRVRGSVSSSRHLARSMKISFTTRSCTLHDKVYETYPIGVAFDDSSEAVTRIQVSALAIDYSTASDRGLGLTPSPFSLPLAV